MNEIKNNGRTFVGYEYKQIITNTNKVSFLIDGYKNFGWTVDENISPGSANRSDPHVNVVLRLKRNRKIINKMELTRLQRNFEFCLKEIDHLEKSKTSEATMYALIAGIAGTAFMAGSVFAVISEPPRIALCVIMTIPAFAGWISSYFIYNYIVSKRTKKASLLIEEKQGEIFEICERGSKLLH
nr:hypothetical protein [uncultured Clostridium sp.]